MFGLIKRLYQSIKSDTNFRKQIKPCISACVDELSKEIIKARINYYSTFWKECKQIIPLIKEPYLRFYNTMNKLSNPNYYIFSLEPFWGKIVVVCGSGDA